MQSNRLRRSSSAGTVRQDLSKRTLAYLSETFAQDAYAQPPCSVPTSPGDPSQQC